MISYKYDILLIKIKNITNLMNIIKFLDKIQPTEVASDNLEVITEIIDNLQTESGKDVYFLRYTKSPLDDIKVGFSAPFFGNEPYSDSLEEAKEIMSNPGTEDDYFIRREMLYWKKDHDFTKNSIYNHSIGYKADPNTCVPVFDMRVGKYIISPEFGLSSFLIKDGDSLQYINKIKQTFYMDIGKKFSDKDWHIFQAKRYTYGDTDNEKELIDNSERIVTMLDASHICSLSHLNLKNKRKKALFKKN